MKVQVVEVFDQDVESVDGERFLTVREAWLRFLERTAPPDVLRYRWTFGDLDVPFPEVLTDGARLAGGAIGWPAPAVP